MNKPLLSVILPAYNAEAYLESAICSILGQSFENFELIVINDGSTDRTGQMLEAIGDRRLRVINHERNAGLISGLNEGIDASTGKYIARMDADDICEPSRFLRQIEYLESHLEIGVLGTAIKMIDERDRPGPTYIMPAIPSDTQWAMPLICPLAHPSVMMRADIVRSLGGYSNTALHAEDYDLWFRMSRETQMANLTEPLICVRKHAASVTSSQRHAHLDSAALVSQAILFYRLEEEVPIPVIRCLRSLGRVDSECAMHAVLIVFKLMARLRLGHPTALTKTIRRDAALRIAYLARHVSGSDRFRVIREAHKVYPFILLAIASKMNEIIVPGMARRLIG
jgi:glycosyltransferase involved in cell wall biosynthesis